MKLYTKTGDDGSTGLYGADRVSKGHIRVESYGTVDELNSILGVVRAAHCSSSSLQDQQNPQRQESTLEDQNRSDEPTNEPTDDLAADLEYLQNALFDLGADLATRTGGTYEKRLSRIDEQDVQTLEQMIDRYQEEAPKFRGFVHPGGTLVAAHLQHARTVARRAEREVIRLMELEEVNTQAKIYLNRLSDLLFVMARAVNARCQIAEDAWLVKGRRT